MKKVLLSLGTFAAAAAPVATVVACNDPKYDTVKYGATPTTAQKDSIKDFTIDKYSIDLSEYWDSEVQTLMWDADKDKIEYDKDTGKWNVKAGQTATYWDADSQSWDTELGNKNAALLYTWEDFKIALKSGFQDKNNPESINHPITIVGSLQDSYIMLDIKYGNGSTHNYGLASLSSQEFMFDEIDPTKPGESPDFSWKTSYGTELASNIADDYEINFYGRKEKPADIAGKLVKNFEIPSHIGNLKFQGE